MTALVRRGSVVAMMVVACALGALVPLALAQPSGAPTDCARVMAERDAFHARERRAYRAIQRTRRQQTRALAEDQRRLAEAERVLEKAKAELAREDERVRRLESVIGKVIDPGLP